VFFYNKHILIILSQQPVYKEVLQRGQNYNKALDLKKETALFMASETTKPLTEGYRGAEDAYTWVD
jgi:hypothetical protein